MKIEFIKNKLDNDWWFDFGITAMPTHKSSGGDYLLSFDLGFWGIYFRFKKQ